jgi:hypothetical protein
VSRREWRRREPQRAETPEAAEIGVICREWIRREPHRVEAMGATESRDAVSPIHGSDFAPTLRLSAHAAPSVAIYSAQIYSLLICILTDPAESSVRHKAEYSASFVLVILAQDQGTRKV